MKPAEFRLCFTVNPQPLHHTALTIALEEDALAISLSYSVREQPLTLRAQAAAGDQVELWIRPHRIELWVNGRLLDEEWPYGEHFLHTFDPAAYGLSLLPLPEVELLPPAITGTFVNAEGWQPEESVFVGDCMPYCDGQRYHVLYLKDRHRHHSKWGLGAHQWAHISTDDFIHWQQHPMAVEITEAWEGSICTGSWIAHEDKQYLFYTVRTCDGSPAPLRRSISKDGYHFTKDETFSFCLSERYHAASARDPKVVRAADGSYHMFVTTSLTATGCGCLAHLISSDLDAWQEIGPIYVAPDENQPECPDYFVKDGWHYLIFSHHGQGEYRYSREPFSGWLCPDEPIIPCKSVPKMALWQNRILFAGFDGQGQYAGTMTFLETTARADGQLTPLTAQ